MIGAGDNVARQVSGAAIWSYLGEFADRALRFGVFVVVARLVSPTEFGMVVLSLLTVEALQGVLDVGLSTALIQQRELSKPQLDTAFLITVGVSALTAIVLFLWAPALTAFVHEDAAAPLLRTLAIVPLINGMGSIHVALIQRDQGFKALAGRRIGSSLVASVVAVLLAVAGFGAWALVVRTLLLAICGTAVAWLATSFRPSLRFDLHSVRSVAPAGLRLWAAGIAAQVNARGFDFLAGVVLGPAALGALRIAGQTVLLLIETTVGPITAAGYALLSRNRRDPKLFEETLVTIANFAALLIFPAFAGLFVVADLLLPLMFGSRWEPAAAITPYMCAVAPALYWHLLVTVALFASGRADRMLHWALIEAAITAAVGLSFARFGLVGLAAAGVLRLYLMTPLGWFWLRRDVGVNPRLLLAPALPSAAAAVVMALIVELGKLQFAPLLAPAVLTWTLVAIGAATYALLLPFSARRLLAQLLNQRAHQSPTEKSTARGRFVDRLTGRLARIRVMEL
jgi:O-antigen/teichoic acid export membrane protein